MKEYFSAFSRNAVHKYVYIGPIWKFSIQIFSKFLLISLLCKKYLYAEIIQWLALYIRVGEDQETSYRMFREYAGFHREV
jgi:hypothetical protein